MDPSNLHAISNSYQDAHLISLKNWKHAAEISPCDQGGPYMISQEGYDPQDVLSRASDFVLGRSGKWVNLGVFYKLPAPMRRAEFVFGSAAEVITLFESLQAEVQIERGEPASPPEAETPGDGLQHAYLEARQHSKPLASE